MSIENVRLFYAKLAEDKELRGKVTRAGEDLKERIGTIDNFKKRGATEAFAVLESFARELGCPFTLQDMEDFEKQEERDLTDIELEGLSGGATCACVIGGGGGGKEGWCACPFVGAGGVPQGKMDCYCLIGGGGVTP